MKVLRVTAYIIRFIDKLRNKRPSMTEPALELNVQEISKVESMKHRSPRWRNQPSRPGSSSLDYF